MNGSDWEAAKIMVIDEDFIWQELLRLRAFPFYPSWTAAAAFPADSPQWCLKRGPANEQEKRKINRTWALLSSRVKSAHDVRGSSRGFHLQLHGRQVGRPHTDDLHQALNVHSRADAEDIGDCVAESSGGHRRYGHNHAEAVLDVVAGDDHREVVEKAEADEREGVEKTHCTTKSN